MKLLFLSLLVISLSAFSAAPNTVRGPAILKPVIYGAIISDTGVVTEIGGSNFINGSCTKSSTNNQNGSCTFVTNIWSGQPNCSFTCGPGAACTYEVTGISNTTLTYRTWSVATSVAYGVNIICFGLSGL